MESMAEKRDAPSSRLREHRTLSLASDLDLLKCMQTLSLKIAGRVDDTLANLDMLDKDASTARICVENCIQNLNLTSTKQFVEKRVYDEEVTDKTEEKIPTSNGVRTQTDFTPKIKEALSFGLPGVKSMLSGVSARPLPYILGSEEFIDCPTAGVVYPQRLQKPVHQQSIPVPTIQSSSSHSSPHQIQDAVLEKSLSSSDVSSISSATPANSVPPSVTQPPANFRGINLQEELAARLKINPEVVTSRPPILAKPNKEQPAVSIHEPDRVKPPSLPVEPKRRNLFDDTSSGSESDSDLFKSAPAIKPPAPTILVPKEPVFQPELPKAPVITSKTNGASVLVKEKQTKRGLFGSSDSEDDLFSTSIPNRSSIKATNPPGNDEVDDIFSSSKQATVVKPTEKTIPPAQTLQINKSKSLFMESDSDDGDLFGPVAPLQPKRPESTLSQVASTSSSRTESPDLNRYQQSTPVKQTVENGRQSNQQAAALKKPAASLLFGDDSDDEDLFSGLPVVKPTKSEIVISKPPISNAIPPAPDSAGRNVSVNVASPPKLEAPKVTSSERVDKSDTVPQPIVKASVPRTAATEGTKKSILFADESDDDDLFKGITPRASTKQQFSPTASHSSGPQFPAVPTFHNQTTKGEVQEQAVPLIKSPQDVVKAPSSSLSPRAMTSPTGDTTEQTKPDVIISSITPTLVSQSGAIEEIRNGASMELPLPADSGAGASSPPSSTGRIAALKLSLSQQPNSLPFSTSQPGSTVTSPTDEVVTNNQSRKPFGGVALFTPIVTNTPKTEQTVESTGSTTTSPTEEARDINQARKPFGGVALFTPPVNETGQTVASTGSASTSPSDEPRAKNQAQKPFGGVSLFPPPVPSTAKTEKPVESQPNKSDIDTDSLPCLAKDRPKAPAARRLPSRSFRRSQILDDQTGSLEIPPSEIEGKEENQVKEKLAPIKKNHKLLDSESSDDELFKPVVAVKGVPTKLLLTNEVKEVSKQPEPKPIIPSIDTSDDEIFKPMKTNVKKLSEQSQTVARTAQPELADATTKTAGGVKSNVKINTTLPLESDSDDGLFNSSSQLPVVLPRKTLAASSLLADSDSDDDLFSSVPKRRDPLKPLPASSGTSQTPSATIKDPLLGFPE